MAPADNSGDRLSRAKSRKVRTIRPEGSNEGYTVEALETVQIIPSGLVTFINRAIVQVPAVRYALGVAAVAAAAELVLIFLGSQQSAPVALGLMFVGMMLLFSFRATDSR